MEIDIRIIPGPEEDGGGIHAKFTFLWAIGNVELTYICAQIDIVPFDFSATALKAMADDPVAFLLSIYIYLGIEIRPTIINIIMEFIEPALRVVLMVGSHNRPRFGRLLARTFEWYLVGIQGYGGHGASLVPRNTRGRSASLSLARSLPFSHSGFRDKTTPQLS